MQRSNSPHAYSIASGWSDMLRLTAANPPQAKINNQRPAERGISMPNI
jgi:hypothetical protein